MSFHLPPGSTGADEGLEDEGKPLRPGGAEGTKPVTVEDPGGVGGERNVGD